MSEITKEERIETKGRPAGYSLIERGDAGPSTRHEEEWPVKRELGNVLSWKLHDEDGLERE